MARSDAGDSTLSPTRLKRQRVQRTEVEPKTNLFEVEPHIGKGLIFCWKFDWLLVYFYAFHNVCLIAVPFTAILITISVPGDGDFSIRDNYLESSLSEL